MFQLDEAKALERMLGTSGQDVAGHARAPLGIGSGYIENGFEDLSWYTLVRFPYSF